MVCRLLRYYWHMRHCNGIDSATEYSQSKTLLTLTKQSNTP